MRRRPWANSAFIEINENPPIISRGNKIKPRTTRGTQSSACKTSTNLFAWILFVGPIQADTYKACKPQNF